MAQHHRNKWHNYTEISKQGEIVVVNPDHNGILIRKDYFLQFLTKNNLDVIWTILGEKNAIEGNYIRNGNSFFKVINGVYFLEDDIISGSLKLDIRN